MSLFCFHQIIFYGMISALKPHRNKLIFVYRRGFLFYVRDQLMFLFVCLFVCSVTFDFCVVLDDNSRIVKQFYFCTFGMTSALKPHRNKLIFVYEQGFLFMSERNQLMFLFCLFVCSITFDCFALCRTTAVASSSSFTSARGRTTGPPPTPPHCWPSGTRCRASTQRAPLPYSATAGEWFSHTVPLQVSGSPILCHCR